METVQTVLTKAQKEQIAKMAARDNLARVNRDSEKVRVKTTFYTKYVKRMFDIVFSASFILITLPVNAILGVCTFFDVGRPVLFQQRRPGKDGKIFTIFKFRNMTNECGTDGELLPAKDRVTKFGKFVRKTSLDELLNFVSVLKGDMSLIGCRPLKEEYLSRYSQRHMMRHAVKPGLECPILTSNSQVRTWQEQFENDVWYVENCSFLTDCKMIIKVIQMVFDRKSNSIRSEATKGGFLGYDENGMAFDSNHIPEKYIKELEEQEKAENRKVG